MEFGESESESRLRAVGFGRLRVEDMAGVGGLVGDDGIGRNVVIGVPRLRAELAVGNI